MEKTVRTLFLSGKMDRVNICKDYFCHVPLFDQFWCEIKTYRGMILKIFNELKFSSRVSRT